MRRIMILQFFHNHTNIRKISAFNGRFRGSSKTSRRNHQRGERRGRGDTSTARSSMGRVGRVGESGAKMFF